MRLLIILSTIYLSATAIASSVTVISNSTDAQECAAAAVLAAQDFIVTKHNISQCSDALLESGLLRRDKAATLVNRGIIFMQLNDFRAAYSDFIAAQKLHPSFGAIYVNLGNIFYLGESYQRALENYNLAIETGLPELHIAYMNRGMTFKAMENPIAALKDFKKALELKPDWTLPQEKIDDLLTVGKDAVITDSTESIENESTDSN